MVKKEKQQKKKTTAFDVINSLLLFIFGMICIYPLYYIFINSCSSPAEVVKGVYFFPRKFDISAYVSIMNIPNILNSVCISVARTVLGSIITVLCSSFVAYLLTHKDLVLKKFFYRYFIITMYVNAGFIPYYILINRLGLKNSFLVYIIPGAISAYFIILVKTYIESLPDSLQESAEIDGAGVFTIFSKIIFPLCLPITACLIVFSAVGQWNSWVDNLYFITDNRLDTLQYLLYKQLQANMSEAVKGSAAAASAVKITPTTLRLAMTFITVLPILCVYPFMQRYFVKGIMLGAVKG